MLYRTKGTCSQAINVEAENGIITKVQFVGGCHRPSGGNHLRTPSYLMSGSAGQSAEAAEGRAVTLILSEKANAPGAQHPGHSWRLNIIFSFFHDLILFTFFRQR